jgi:hypothetical protein
MKKTILTQFFVLLVGTLFAWYNFIVEWIAYSKSASCTIGCTAGTNPFLSPCFGGAVFFTIALVLNLIMLKKSK